MRKARARIDAPAAKPGRVISGRRSVGTGLAAEVANFKGLLTQIGRLRSIRDPLGDLAPDLTRPQLHTLLWLGADGELSPGVLAERVGCAQPSVTGVIDRLERAGYVERARDTVDRRVVKVRLTAAGRAMSTRLASAFDAQLALLLGMLDPADRRALGRVLERIATVMSAANVPERTR